MYLTVAYHATGHGDSASVLCITQSIEQAVVAASLAEPMGYHFLAIDNGISILELLPEALYPNDAFKFHGDNPPPGHPVVAFFRKRDGVWHLESCSVPVSDVRTYFPNLLLPAHTS